jgi:hypothetical protein
MKVVFLALSAMCVLVVVPTAAGADSATSSHGHICGLIKANGHTYQVSTANHVACPFALKSAATLVKEPVPARTPIANLSGSPSGFKCTGTSKPSTSSYPGVAATTQINGECLKGAGFSAPFFQWIIEPA